ncbi:Hydroxyneurosporene synthase [Penicillium cf. griseofulvum]|uniref:Hydroxyneurosporene synthase n=1 Tax=Penicillium cf. griseofulvum TaxID=2972120 RepID=A0A9W9MUE4_9EURO|nr:Hydroxyneurosporene synthase [Penicillium cf. griseofulvum]KAJ5445755.1 Hydroxyneurosporene synthase [Penicillium cf. griseofulvum]KAJ5447477.1 Hydroxyneurosporene synthase [Penicillium cf. griseofulvum]
MLPQLLLLICALPVQTLAFSSQHAPNEKPLPHPRAGRYSRSGKYHIPGAVQNGTSKARFDIPTPKTTLDTETLFSLDAPQIDRINGSVFDWWYFDVVSETNPDDSLVVTFFTSSMEAFPFLDPNETSILNAWVWASFANGTVFEDSVPATVATVTGADGRTNSTGDWSSTGFTWNALTANLSRYEVIIASEKLQVEGRLTLTSRTPSHLPCGVQLGRTILEIAPHIGWVNLVPDAVGEVDMKIYGSTLKFRGPGYHDKVNLTRGKLGTSADQVAQNWSDRPFIDSVQSWYWGHGRLGPYSIVWFSYLAINDTTNTTYVSSYVAKDGEMLVSACDPSVLTVRPVGRGTTGRYPPRARDIPEGFIMEFDLGEAGQLNVNVSARTVVAGDEEYYMRWTGDMVGEVESEGGGGGPKEETGGPDVHSSSSSSLAGVAVLEQFVLLE